MVIFLIFPEDLGKMFMKFLVGKSLDFSTLSNGRGRISIAFFIWQKFAFKVWYIFRTILSIKILFSIESIYFLSGIIGVLKEFQKKKFGSI